MLPVPEFLAVGHVTRDVHPDGTFSLGGTATFAAFTACRLGLKAGVVTCADAQLTTALPAYLPNISLHVRPSEQTTTFANYYQGGHRIQYLQARGTPLHIDDVPESWQLANIVLLGPLAQEMSSEFVKLFPRRPGMIIAATPQGWLRRWDDDGRVWPIPWEQAEQILPSLDVLVLSHEDLLPFTNGKRAEADALLTHWSKLVSILVATDGQHGATLFLHGKTQQFPAYAVNEVDPTGAGDVFAAAFLIHLSWHGDPACAVEFANCVAAFSIEQIGIHGIPTLTMVESRLRSLNQ